MENKRNITNPPADFEARLLRLEKSVEELRAILDKRGRAATQEVRDMRAHSRPYFLFEDAKAFAIQDYELGLSDTATTKSLELQQGDHAALKSVHHCSCGSPMNVEV